MSDDSLGHADSDDVQTLLGLEQPAGYCWGGNVAHLARRNDPVKQKVTKYSCARWTCRVCGPRRRLELGTHFAGKLLLATGTLFHRSYTAAEWHAGRKWLNRHGCSWVRVGVDGSPCDVFGSMPVPEDDRVTVYSHPERLIQLLGCKLLTMSVIPESGVKRFRPAGWSWDWKLPFREEPQYLRLTWLRGVKLPDQAITLLRSRNIEATKRKGTTDAEWDVVFSAPPEFRFDFAQQDG